MSTSPRAAAAASARRDDQGPAWTKPGSDLGNLLGGLVVGVLTWMSALTQGAVLVETADSVQHKLGSASAGWAGWGDPFARAVLCNLLINLAMLLVWHVPVKDDPTRSPVMATAVVVFVPAFSGLDHSVADTVLFSMVGLREGISLGLPPGTSRSPCSATSSAAGC